jgi:hypothetical protein
MKKTITSLFLLMLQIAFAQLHTPKKNEFKQFNHQELKCGFEENKGQVLDQFRQIRTDVLFIGCTRDLKFISRENGYSYQLTKELYKNFNLDINETFIEVSRVDINWIGSNKNTKAEFSEIFNDYTNYYNIPNQKNGVINVRNYGVAKVVNIYDGINVKYYFNNGQIEYDYEIEPWADYKKIKVEINGAQTSLNENGEIIIETALGKIIESALKVYQNGKLLDSEWLNLENNIWTFYIPDYNPEFALLIDPIVRVWSTYFTGNNYDYLYSVSADSENYIYAAGSSSSNNIATSGAFNSVFQGEIDGIITKFDENGNRLWSTFLGGNNQDNINKIITKSEEGFIVCGQTRSSDFYTSISSYQEFYCGEWDGFISFFNSDGTNVWSTYLGGESDDFAYSLDVYNDVVYVCGATMSLNNISTNSAHQTSYGGGVTYGMDGFLMKFDLNGSRIYGTYYGGENGDYAFDVKVDQSGDFFIIGYTNSENNISTSNSYQETFGGGNRDGFFAKFNPEGSRIFSSYFGGNGADICRTIIFDNNNNFLIAGETNSSNAIATSNSFQSEFGGGLSDCFLSKFSSTGDLIWSTYFGSVGIDAPAGTNESLLLDSNGNIFLFGNTSSASDIATSGSFQDSYNGGSYDGFIANFNASGNLNFSSYYGGQESDFIYGNTSLNNGNFILVGETKSDNFSTPNSFQNNHQGLSSGFISKFNYCLNTYMSESVSACKNFEDINGEILTESGLYTYILQNHNGCDSILTFDITIENLDLTIYQNENILSSNQANATYQWIDCDKNNTHVIGETNQTFTPRSNSRYAVIINYNGCTDTTDCYQVNNVNIESIQNINQIKFYPNPAQDYITVDLGSIDLKRKLHFEIATVIGQVVDSGKIFENQQKLNLAKLESNVMYFIKLYDGESLLITQMKFIKR